MFLALCFPTVDALWPAASRSYPHDFPPWWHAFPWAVSQMLPRLSCILSNIWSQNEKSNEYSRHLSSLVPVSLRDPGFMLALLPIACCSTHSCRVPIMPLNRAIFLGLIPSMAEPSLSYGTIVIIRTTCLILCFPLIVLISVLLVIRNAAFISILFL